MITINDPAVEALIHQRQIDGGFMNVEAVLTQALLNAPLPKASHPGVPKTGAELLAALMNSPYKEVDLEGERYYPPVSEPVEF